MKTIHLKLSLRGLFFAHLFLLVCLLPVALFRIGYKFNLVSKELVLLLFLNLLVVGFAVKKNGLLKIQLPHILLLIAAAPVFLLNWGSFHALAVVGLFLILLLLLSEIIAGDKIFVWLAWSALLATILSFYQYWSTAYGVVPDWLQLPGFSSRMAGVFGQANLLACLIVIGLFSWLQTLWQRFGQAGWRWFHQIPVVVFFWALLLTGSKAGMLAFVSSLLLLGLGLTQAGKSKLLIFLAVQLGWSLSLGLVLFLFVQAPGVETLQVRGIDFNEESASTGARLIFWGSALNMGYDHLWSGVGIGGYRAMLGSYMVPVAEWLHIPYDAIVATLWAHNDFLHVLAECGLVVFLTLLFVFTRMLFSLWPTRNPQALFCFCALWSFFVCMQFGHPFNDHVLVFYLIFLTSAALQLAPEKFILRVPKKLFIVLLVPCLLFINFQILSYARSMSLLKDYMTDVVKSNPMTVERLTSLRADHRYHDLVQDPLHGWVFQFTHLQALGNYAVQHTDRPFAAYLIPEIENFQAEHSAYALTYVLARLYFIAGEYSMCKKTADQAYALKPDMYHYSNFGHICLVFDISQREKIPVSQLLGKTYFDTLLENRVFKLDVLDENQCPL